MTDIKLEILSYAKDNPSYSYADIGKKFKISRQRVHQIIRYENSNNIGNLPKKNYYWKKITVLKHYGHDKVECVRCGFSDIRALSIDHINGDGYIHRKELKGKNLYEWLIENDFPEGFRTFCMNCQWIVKAERSHHYRRLFGAGTSRMGEFTKKELNEMGEIILRGIEDCA